MLLGKHIVNGSSGPSIPVGEKWTFTSNGTWEAPAKGNYKITLVGAGGKGGSGGPRTQYKYRDSETGSSDCLTDVDGQSGSGGGGGAGETIIQTHNLKQSDVLTITIGKPNSNPSKVTGAVTITANGGNTGGSAGIRANNSTDESMNCKHIAYAGGLAANYGTGGSAGYTSRAYNHRPVGGSGKVSTYGNGYGTGGQGGYGEWRKNALTGGYNGTAGICIIEYLGR